MSRAEDGELAARLANYRFLNRMLAWDDRFEKQIMALTPEQIVTAMRQYINPAKTTIVKAGDFAQAASR